MESTEFAILVLEQKCKEKEKRISWCAGMKEKIPNSTQWDKMIVSYKKQLESCKEAIIVLQEYLPKK